MALQEEYTVAVQMCTVAISMFESKYHTQGDTGWEEWVAGWGYMYTQGCPNL